MFSWNLNTFTKHKEQSFLFICLFFTHYIKTVFLKILQYSPENTCVKFLGYSHGYFSNDFTKWLLETLFLNGILNYFDSVILQKYLSLSNQSFKQSLTGMANIYLNHMISCEPRFPTQKVSACSP